MTKPASYRALFLRSTIVFLSIFLTLQFTTDTFANTSWETSITPVKSNLKQSGGKSIYTFTATRTISPDSALTLAKALRFKKNNIDVYSDISNVKKPVWVYFKTDCFLSPETHLLVIENCNFNLITLYKYRNDSLQCVGRKGMSLPYQHDNLFPEQTSFVVEPNTIYFIEAYDLYNIILPIYIRTNTQNIQSSILRNYFNGFYWGVIGVMGVVALFFFIRSKERAFIYYSLFLFGTIILNLCLEGYLFAYVWPNHPEINSNKVAIYSLSAITTPLFVYHFLDFKTYYPGTKFVF
ncbi:MAG TPA: 7TM-DISM domain-containing protein, partial [Cytophaga sp.]|nr:7TM-DISM domain-containing protein [Cytophaga sp.]